MPAHPKLLCVHNAQKAPLQSIQAVQSAESAQLVDTQNHISTLISTAQMNYGNIATHYHIGNTGMRVEDILEKRECGAIPVHWASIQHMKISSGAHNVRQEPSKM